MLFIVSEFYFRLSENNLELVAMEVLILLLIDQKFSSIKNLKNYTYLHVLPRFLVPPVQVPYISLNCWMKILKLMRLLFSSHGLHANCLKINLAVSTEIDAPCISNFTH